MKKVRGWGSIVGALLLAATTTTTAANAEGFWQELQDEEYGRISLQARGGINGYTSDIGDLTAPGPLWGIQASAQQSEYLGIELAYEGSRNPIDDVRLTEDAALFRNGLAAMAKVSPGFLELPVRPYAGAGLGFSYLNPGDGAEDLYSTDFVMEIPLAVGVDYTNKWFIAGIRGNYTAIIGENFANTALPVGEQATGNLLEASLTAGGRF
jgi:hypothetical protein